METNTRTITREIGGTTYIVRSPIIGSKEDKKAVCEKVKTLILNNIKKVKNAP
jgi:hypothetical protein